MTEDEREATDEGCRKKYRLSIIKNLNLLTTDELVAFNNQMHNFVIDIQKKPNRDFSNSFLPIWHFFEDLRFRCAVRQLEEDNEE